MATGLQPYGHQPAQLTGGARFIRGFRRIGLAFGTAICLLGSAFTIYAAVQAQSTANARFEQAVCMAVRSVNKEPIKMKSYDNNRIDFDANGCSTGPFYYESLSTVLTYAKEKPGPLQYAIEPLAWGLPISFALAAAAYFFFWTVGWLCAGFTKD